MDKQTLNAMVRSDRTGRPLVTASELGLSPIYIERNFHIGDCFEGFLEMSRKFWTYRGYTGLGHPWHDGDNPRRTFNYFKKSLTNWLNFSEMTDVHWKTLLVLSLCMLDYQYYDRPSLLTGNAAFRNRFKNLRQYAGSRQRMDDIAFFMMEFIQLQIEYMGRVRLPVVSDFLTNDPTHYHSWSTKVKKKKAPKKVLGIYRSVCDRIGQFEQLGVDYADWMRAKVDNLRQKVGADEFTLPFILNVNSLDPDLEKLRTQIADPWREIKKFLELPDHCSMPDGSIPKGWFPATEDQENRRKIVSITKDGYYYYADGTQWRGKRHYATNKYLVIKCTPENFHCFRSSWYDNRLLTGKPTWEEYNTWAAYPGIWDEAGRNVSTYRGIKDLKWRRP